MSTSHIKLSKFSSFDLKKKLAQFDLLIGWEITEIKIWNQLGKLLACMKLRRFGTKNCLWPHLRERKKKKKSRPLYANLKITHLVVTFSYKSMKYGSILNKLYYIIAKC